jgi:hypothetical protein
VHHIRDDFSEQTLFVAEVFVDGLFRNSGRGSNLIHAGTQIAIREERLSGRLEDRCPLTVST